MQKLYHWVESPRDYIASFVPDVDTPQLPFTVNLRLGKVARIFISLTVDDPHRVFWKHTQGL
ncbi:hypothetical protein P691DRAFT_804814 [Macrolepiota fuliginosa MF-IS2]|uniref:Uncharacterized protein n=1 Tax=Macrolepiota fuliginosa MF-IS2 TaxID=1400762 RepID=A0A9P6C251_9AGAR|nr:hypothetical protein P691DRAFT_804814 [Macrolepiota fuliginosa MF-IS2]